MYETRVYEQVIQKSPEAIGQYISNYVTKSTAQYNPSQNEDKYLLENQLALRIYLDCTGHGLSYEKLKNRYGEMGTDELYKMINMKILQIDEKLHITWGEVVLSNGQKTTAEIGAFFFKHVYSPKIGRTGLNALYTKYTSISPAAYYNIIAEVEASASRIQQIIRQDDVQSTKKDQSIKLAFAAMVDKLHDDNVKEIK